MAKSQTPSCRGAEPLSDCALCAQGRRGVCGLAGVLPPWHDRCHGSRKGQCPLTPHRAHRARGCSGDMPVDREATAARRQASRLAGLVRLPAGWQVHTAIRRQASWLATKASVILISRWPFALQKIPRHNEASHLARGKSARRQLRGSRGLFSFKLQNSQTMPKHPTLQGVSLPHANCGQEKAPIHHCGKVFQLKRSISIRKGCVCPPPTAGEPSGDRQRREKGPPILTAEKGEHERAPRAGESCPTPLRATLRAPPSKWAIKGFFP